MKIKNFKKIDRVNKSAGQISKIFIILAVIILIVIIIFYAVVKITGVRNPKSENNSAVQNEPPPPVYETTIGNIRFLYESAQDFGSTLVDKTPYQQHLRTTDKFIKVVIGAQNKGMINVEQYSWGVGNIVDSAGRNFISINEKAYAFLPQLDLCGAILKPEFEPTPCVKIYEVSKVSNELKIEVFVGKQKALLDLIIL